MPLLLPLALLVECEGEGGGRPSLALPLTYLAANLESNSHNPRAFNSCVYRKKGGGRRGGGGGGKREGG